MIGGLKPLKPDKRDFSYQKVFGSIKAEALPDFDFVVAEPIKIENQKETDFCTGYASSSVSEAHRLSTQQCHDYFAHL